MPSIFSRSRTTSTTQLANVGNGHVDEFGARSATPSTLRVSTYSTTTSGKKKKSKKGEEVEEPPPIPDGTFLPLHIPSSPSSTSGYGYIGGFNNVTLGLEQVARLVEVVVGELGSRGGITTPFIFSSLALDIHPPAIQRLISAFLRTFEIGLHTDAEGKWREEARFAGVHELGMCLRWGLSRVVRIDYGGRECKGLLRWEEYERWRDQEIDGNYPSTAFSDFLPVLQPPQRSILITTLSLLTRLTANSASSGHTPPTLSPLFGPLFFGLPPQERGFHETYTAYLKATNATEHLLLSFIRWQDTAEMGVPTRLKEWIKSYPSILSPPSAQAQNRKGARTTRVLSVRRNVRGYTPDLVRSASTWAGVSGGINGNNALAKSREWSRIKSAGVGVPRYSDNYRKRMNLGGGVHPELNASELPHAPSLASSTNSSYLSSSTSSDSRSVSVSGSGSGSGSTPSEERFRSLTDLKWGEFESLGFDGLGGTIGKSLQFDLTESARTERTKKRQTLTWNDFSSAGFTRMDAPLSATLQFSLSSPSSSPTKSTAPTTPIKLSKQKKVPAFTWDMTPVFGSEQVLEEAFLDVFCDLVVGAWNKSVEKDGESAWGLVEYKAGPNGNNTLILFEEFVPAEYRAAVYGTGKSHERKRLNSLFSVGGDKSTPKKPSLGRSTTPVPKSPVTKVPSPREVEFEGLLKGSGTTKLNLSTPPVTPTVEAGDETEKESSSHAHAHLPPTLLASVTSPKKKFTLPRSSKRESMPAQYSSVDFEARPVEEEEEYDAWVDILVARQRLDDQAAEMRRRAPDPEEVSLEIERVLAGVGRSRSSTPLGGAPAAPAAANREEEEEEEENDFEPVRDSAFTDNIRDSAYTEREAERERERDSTFIDDVEIQTIPRANNNNKPAYVDSDADDEESDEESESVLTKVLANKRPGYFDLHPERRQAVVSEYDPRERFSEKDEDEEEEEDDGSGRPLPQPPAPAAAAAAVPVSSPRALPATPEVGKSKTAALIEMYREKEKGTSAAAAAAAAPTASPANPPAATTPATNESSKPESLPLPPTPPTVVGEEQGRASPARYIHGAPLHNVLEEEEED